MTATSSCESEATQPTWSKRPNSKPAAASAPRPEIYHEIAVQCICDPQERVDARRTPTTFQARDRRLRRPDELRQLPLRVALLLPALRDLVGDRGKEPSAIGGADPLLQPF